MAKFRAGDKVRIKTAGCGGNENPVGTEGEVVSVFDFGGNQVATVAFPRGSHGWPGEGNVPHWNFGMPHDGYPADHWLELVQTQPIPVGANPPEDKKVDADNGKPPEVADISSHPDFVAKPEPKRENILEEALRVTGGDRRRDYGSAKVNHERIALLWAAWDVISRGTEDQIAEALATVHGQMLPTAEGTDGRDPGLFKDLDSARDVAMKMILLKIAREANTPKRDNKVDIAGYARCLSQIDSEEGEF